MSVLQRIAASALIDRLGWALLHSLWQVSVVAIGLALILPALRKRGAHLTYGACCAALLFAGLAPAATFPWLASSPGQDAFAPAGLTERVFVQAGSRVARMEFGRTGMVEATSAANPSRVDSRTPAVSDDRAVPPAVGVPTQRKNARGVAERGLLLLRAAAERVSPRLPWIVLLWSLGVFALAFRNVAGWLAAQRLKSRATSPVPPSIDAVVARLARLLGLFRTVRLLQSALVDSPMVIGAIKPVILLPACLVSGLPPDQLEALLAHELAHVARHDYLVNLLQCALETLFFYHPAVWWISAQVRREREHCCDDRAVRLVCSRAVYVKALAAVAGARVPALTPAASGGLLLPRLRRVLGKADPQTVHPSRWLASAALLAFCLGAAVYVALDARPAQGRPPGLAEDTATPELEKETPKPAERPAEPRKIVRPHATTEGSMRIRVVDSAREPISQAQIHVSVWTDESFAANRDYATDAKGEVTIDLPETLWILRLWASKKGYAGMFINMAFDAQVHELVIPEEFEFRLSRGTTLGGLVQDEQGRPIEGAQVTLGTASERGNQANAVRSSFFDEKAVTDAEGRWQIEDAPPGDDVQFGVHTVHPDYLSEELAGELERKQAITTRALRAQSATIVLRRGKVVTGKVTDPQGKPVENAIVTWGEHPYWSRETHLVRTNAEGVYRFGAIPTGETTIAVVADGWMPTLRKVAVSERTQSSDFQLQPGKKLRIRFVDRAGNPVPGVGILIDGWRGTEALSNFKPWVPDITIPSSADKDGVFEWSWAPDDAVAYRFEKQGYAESRSSIAADGSEHVQTIGPLLRISGRVRDSVTGIPVDDYLVIPVNHFRSDFVSLDRSRAQQQQTDTFTIDFDRTTVAHGIQIEAPGYFTYRAGSYELGDADPALDVRLQPAERYLGHVVDPRGRPVSDAQIHIGTTCEQLSLVNNGTEDSWANQIVESDRTGAFEIAAQIDRYGLIVITPQGYAEVEREANEKPGTIRIEPWARVTGRLVQSGKPVARHEIMLWPVRNRGGEQLRVFTRLQTATADDGSFVFERVPPTPGCVSAALHWSRESDLESSYSAPLHPKPGEEINLTLGNGIDITGRLVAENQSPGFDYHFSLSYLVARRPGIEPPAALATNEFDWRKGWNDACLHTPEGHTYLETLHHWFVKPQPDGRFTISGVEPGEYDFAVNLYGAPEGGCLVHPVATRVIRVSVNPGASRLDLGELSIPSLAPPKIGEPASDFEFLQPDGTKTSLSAVRGKYVLLDFWAIWCRSCVGSLENVERVRQEFADLGLVVVGLNLDADRQRAREFLEGKSLPWRQALLGEWSSTDIPRRYAVSSLPSYVLIDRDGRIIAREFELEALVKTLKDLAERQREH